MKQTRTHSLIEAVANIAIGAGVSFSAQLVVYPLLGIAVSMAQNVAILLIFTVISIVRSYLLRRMFEHIRVHWTR
jgi:hypothetical protein